MFNKILLIDHDTILGHFWGRSLAAEGYELSVCESLAAAKQALDQDHPDLVLINAVDRGRDWLATAEEYDWAAPTISVIEEGIVGPDPSKLRLPIPFAFQDLLLLVQDALYHRTLVGNRPFQLSANLMDDIEGLLDTLRGDLRARCVILSSSSGRLIKTAGSVEQGAAISLAALVAAGFVATARASQLLGHGEMFDSNLQESEGYGLYAVRLHDKLILSVDFSARITIGMVRHYTAQAAVDILELIVENAEEDADVEKLKVDDNFRATVNDALSNLLDD